MAQIFAGDFESGVLATGWTAAVTDGGDLAIASPGLAGTDYCMSWLFDDANEGYVYRDLGANNTSGIIRARYYVDSNSVSLVDGESFPVLAFVNASSLELCTVFFSRSGSNYRFNARMALDSGSFQYTANSDNADGEYYIEILLTRAANSSSNDGHLSLWVNGTQVGSTLSYDNYDRFANLRTIVFGPSSGVEAGNTGTLLLDELVVRDDNTLIGPVSTGISGSLSATLGALESTAAGTVEIEGTATVTLAALSSTAAGKVDIVGELTAALAAATVAAAGTVDVNGTLTVTLDALTVTAAGVVGNAPAYGEASITLGALTATAAGSVDVVGEASITLVTLTASGAAVVRISGAAAVTLEGAALSAGGAVAITGAASVTLEAVTLTAGGVLGNPPVSGAADITLDALSASGAGTVMLSGQAALALSALSMQGSGAVRVEGSAAISLDALSMQGAGVVGTIPIIGQAALMLDPLTGSGAGFVQIEGAGAAILGALLAAGAGKTLTRGSAELLLGMLSVISSGYVGEQSSAPVVITLSLAESEVTSLKLTESMPSSLTLVESSVTLAIVED